MNKQIIITASVLGMLATIAGAFGSHGLKAVLPASDQGVWHIAVQYNFYHVFALLFLSTFSKERNKLIAASYYLFTLGVVFFSGSLYLLSCRTIIGWSWLIHLGPVTPLGGLCFILGWLMLAIAAYKSKPLAVA